MGLKQINNLRKVNLTGSGKVLPAALSCFLLQSSGQLQPKNLIKHWSVEDGLSQTVVNGIVQQNQFTDAK
jgi:hypothetical protein